MRSESHWGDDNWVREHLRQWGIKQRLAKEPPGWKAKRERWSAEAAAQANELPSHIANLIAARETTGETARPALEAEIERRLAAHKENHA